MAIRTWSERTLRHRESGERVRITVTGDDGERVFGIPISPGDRRIVFARMDWIVERK